jgi:uncharacterized protein (DUF427 family)
VVFNGVILAETNRAKRVVETAGAPVYYIPPQDVRMDLLTPSEGRGSFCEWKGSANYVDVTVDGERAYRVAWFFPEPTEGYRTIKDHLAFYVHKMEACYVDGEKARPQPGSFYGGWVTDDIVGPIKGEPGTEWW